MKNIISKITSVIFAVILLYCTGIIAVNANEVNNEYEYTVENNIATITNYLGTAENVIVPAKIDGYNVKSVSFYAFMKDNSKNIKKVVVSEGIEFVGNWLFTNSNDIESITLPSTIKELPTDCFFIGGTKLNEFKFSGSNSRYYIQDGVLYDSLNKSLMLCPAQNKFANGEYEIVSGTKSLRGWAFVGCENLKKIIIPNSVTMIGDHAFSECTNIKDIVFSENIVEMGYNSFGGLVNLKGVTIPKSVKGFYYNGQTTNTYLGYNGTKKIDNFTIKGYKNSEAEKYANDNGFKFIALDADIDYSKYNPIDFIGMSLEKVTNIFGNDYSYIDEPEAGDTKFIYFPNGKNPFEIGFSSKTNLVKAVYVYDLSVEAIGLFDDITNKSLVSEIEKPNTKYSYTISNDVKLNDLSQVVDFDYENGIKVSFEWTSNDKNNQPANRVLVLQTGSEPTTTPNIENPTKGESAKPNPTSSTEVISNDSTADTATQDSIKKDNGTIQTGAISIMIIVFVLLVSLASVCFVYYRRKFK